MKWIKRMTDCISLALATVAVTLMLYHWPLDQEYSLIMTVQTDSYLVRILYVPLLTTWWLINSVVSPRVRQSLDPEPAGSLPTREQQT